MMAIVENKLQSHHIALGHFHIILHYHTKMFYYFKYSLTYYYQELTFCKHLLNYEYCPKITFNNSRFGLLLWGGCFSYVDFEFGCTQNIVSR